MISTKMTNTERKKTGSFAHSSTFVSEKHVDTKYLNFFSLNK